MSLRRFIPASVKTILKDQFRLRQLTCTVRTISAFPDRVPDATLLQALIRGWGNEGYSATTSYLQEMSERALATEGTVLECGSGVSTILLNLLCAPRKMRVISLEHFPDWQAHVQRTLKRFDLNPAAVTLAPLRNYGEYTWYDAPIRDMPKNISLVICDGPPGDTPGGRYGLLPRCIHHLTKDAIILLDDADRPKELEALERWKREFRVSVEMKCDAGHCYAIVRLPE